MKGLVGRHYYFCSDRHTERGNEINSENLCFQAAEALLPLVLHPSHHRSRRKLLLLLLPLPLAATAVVCVCVYLSEFGWFEERKKGKVSGGRGERDRAEIL